MPMSRSLPNYLRTFRRRAHLSQADVARLLGGTSGTTVARHETGERQPTLETALAYAAIYAVDVRELFAGVYEGRLDAVTSQAESLLQLLSEVDGDELTRRKIDAIQLLLEYPEPHFVPWEELSE